MARLTEAELQGLLKRCNAVTGPDYDLDLDLACTYGPFVRQRYTNEAGEACVAFFMRCEPIKGQWAFASGLNTPGRFWHFSSTPRYSQSLDAAIKLFEEALPGWEMDLAVLPGRKGSADVRGPRFCDEDMTQFGQSEITTLPKAVVGATLRALLSERARGDGECLADDGLPR